MSDKRTTHGMKALMLRMASERLTRRQQRALGRVAHGLTADTLPHLHALTVGHLSRLEMLWQGYQAHAIAHPDQPFPTHAIAIGNAWRRMAETLLTIEAQLERDTVATSTCSRCGWRGDTAGYVHHDCRPPASPPIDAPTAAGAHTVSGGPSTTEDA